MAGLWNRRGRTKRSDNGDRVGMTVTLGKDPVLMPRQLGYERGVQNVSVRVEIALENKLPEIPE